MQAGRTRLRGNLLPRTCHRRPGTCGVRYVFGLGTVDAVSIGFDAREQIDEVIGLMGKVL